MKPKEVHKLLATFTHEALKVVNCMLQSMGPLHLSADSENLVSLPSPFMSIQFNSITKMDTSPILEVIPILIH